MRLTEDALRAMHRTAAADTRHPAAEDFVRAATGRLRRKARKAFADHVAECAECADEFRTLETLRPWADRSGADSAAAARVSRESRRQRRPRLPAGAWLPAAAAAAGIMLLVVVAWPARHSDLDLADRPSSSSRAVAPRSVTLVEPSERQTGLPTRFAWKPVEGADEYRATVYREDGTPVWTQAESASTTIERPSLPQLAPGIYYWQVIALRAGDQIADSRLSPIRIDR